MANPRLEFEGDLIELRDGETVLEALLRSGKKVASACRAGACQTCLLRAKQGQPPETAQRPLKETLRLSGCFLACVARPTADLSLVRADEVTEKVPARIEELTRLTRDVLRVRLRALGPFAYRAGQFVNFVRADGLMRPYSLASVPGPGGDERLELHVRLIPNGQLSTWLDKHAVLGDVVELRGPIGECFYVPGRPEQPLVLVGSGTGLAPLYGIARDALAQGHRGPITLLHAGRTPARLYYQEELRQIAKDSSQFTYLPCVLEGGPDDERSGPLVVGAIGDAVAARFPKAQGLRAFLCGDPDFVNKLRRQLFLAGASRRELFADSFFPAVTTTPT